MSYFTEEQVNLLLRPIHPKRVLQRDGMSYVEGYDIRAELNRVFGFGRWSEEVLDQSMICEKQVKTKGGKDAWYVVYRTRERLTVNAPDGTCLAHYDGSHVGESTHPVIGEAHGNALTNSETYALRRCAINLGDQFGLSLYNKGSRDALVRWTLVRPEPAAEKVNTDDVLQVSAEGSLPAPVEEAAGSAGETFDNAGPVENQQAQQQVSAEQEWLAVAVGKAAGHATLDACKADWQTSVKHVNDGKLTRAEVTPLQNKLRARIEELKAAEAGVVEGKIADLDPSDPWAQKVADLADQAEADAALDEIGGMVVAGTMDAERGDRIEVAIRARFPQAGRTEAAAA